ncbi:diguanylate cyclase domain-containing protein [Roseateles albus]|uniref:histidine kinase n=1 Tax=Roseateles albus TaxID=2987525 RepID=A0ABT5KIQ7_9BURK|nr:diguanylate cyclase [Roseateles albus]MDC8773389.1 diguanylate cyclase [Roseateles albus]
MTPPVAKAEQELTHITERVEAMRAVLVRLLQDVVRAESFLEQNQSVQLLEANEQLVLTSLGAQVASESALQALEEAARASGLDPLTQLANRSLAFDRLERAIAHAKRQGTQLALLFVDLDKFKQINDSKGHAVGDQVLQQVANCLLSAVRESDTVSRHGGDEFLILLDDLPQVNDALGVAEKLKDMLQLARTANDNWGELSASIGISIYPRDAGTADALIACADLAMYMAKRQGPGGISFFVDDADPLELSPPVPQGSAQGPTEPAMRALQRHSAELARELVKQEQRHLLLREANEQLVLASLSAQDLQAAAAAAQERNSEFMVGVAAELNDPMSPIRIAMAALGRPPDATPLLPHASNLMALQATLIRGFVSDLLQQEQAAPPTDADKARLLLMLEPLDLAALLDHCAQECQPLLARREQQLQFEPAIKTAPTLWVQGDALRLSQVLSNLLSNASRYSHRGGLIQLSLQRLDAQAVISVTDAGIGISPQALQRIFEPFGREFHAVGVYGEALGLGLTAVREIVEAHGGTVRASSAGVGLGSQFMVTLPLSA